MKLIIACTLLLMVVEWTESIVLSTSAATNAKGIWRSPTTTIFNKGNNKNNNKINQNDFEGTENSINNDSNKEKQALADSITQFVAECQMPTIHGTFKMRSYRHSSPTQNLEPIVIVSGDLKTTGNENVLVRVHDQCLTSEVFGSKRCDCRDQLEQSLALIKEHGGVVIYLQQEGRGIGIANKIAAYALQDQGMDTVDANLHLGFRDEMREYLAVPAILRDLNIDSIRLMTNNPFKIESLKQLGVKVADRFAVKIPANRFNIKYLTSKRDRMAHMLTKEVFSSSTSTSTAFKAEDAASASRVASSKFASVNQAPSSSPASAPSLAPSTSPSAASRATTTATAATPVKDSLDWQKLATVHKDVPYIFGRSSVERAIEEVRAGKMVLVVDDANRENEGDLIMAAEHATAANTGFIVRHSSGVLCVSLKSDRLQSLALPPMVVNNEDPKQTAYTVSVDCKHNTTTGISSADRAVTFCALASPASVPADFTRPGHVFPLRYREGGVLVRGGHTEASMDLSLLAGCQPAAVLAEVVNDDGSVMRLQGLKQFAQQHGLVLTSVQDLIAFRAENVLRGVEDGTWEQRRQQQE